MAEHIKNFARLSFDSILRLFPSRRFRIFALIILATLVTSGVLVLAHPSFATDVPISGIGDAIVRALVWLMLQLATIFIQLTVFLLRFFILIAGYNNYINAPVVLLGWNMVRDVANMFFIVVLMVIAFGTILGLEQYEWRKSLVKLVLAAILVNFSNLIIQLMIDVAQVFTITFLNAVAGAAGGNLIQMFNFDKIFDIAVGSPEEMTGELLFNLFGAGVISLVFAGMAMFTMGAYVVVLLARVVVLWMAIILSPLMFMFSVLPQTKKYADEYWSEVSNHILAAPVMVFFMWLAFATFGGGSGAVAHLEDGHGLKEQGKITTKETNLGTKPSVGIGKAASWENMANFAVALAFLWLGIDRVQKLGVKGGGLTQSAMNFGKNVATIASGYAAGRWLAGKGADLGMSALTGTAKGIGNRIPLVGGAALKEYGAAIASTYKRKGALGVLSAGKVSGFGGAASKIKKSAKAKEWEEKGLYKGFGGKTLGWLAARTWEPSERALKRKEDWEAAGERMKKIQDESYSTSGTRAGQAKLNATTELKKVEEKAAAKAAAKVTERLQEVREIKDIYDDHKKQNPTMSEEELKTKTLADFLAKVQSEKGVAQKEKVEQLIKRDGGIDARLDLANKVQSEIKATVTSKATSEEGDNQERQLIEEAQAKARDAVREQQGLPPIHLAAIRDKHQKELEEAMSGLNFRELTRQAGNYMARGLSSPAVSRAAAATLSVAMKRGSETGITALNQMLEKLGFGKDATQSIDADDMEGQQRLMLSALLGQKLEAGTNLDAKFQEFATSVGGEERAQAILKNLDSNFKVAAADGAVNMSGLFDDQTVDPKTGRIKFQLQKNKEAFRGNRDYFAEEVNITKLTGVEDMISKNGLKDKNGNIDNQAVAQMVKVLSSAKQNTRFHSRFITSMQNLYARDADGLNQVLSKVNDESRRAIEKLLGIASASPTPAGGGRPAPPPGPSPFAGDDAADE